MTYEESFKKIQNIIDNHFSSQKDEFVPGKSRLPLVKPSFGADEINEAIDSLFSTWVTMGKKVKTFEERFASYLGVKNATMLNSGSSANLVALSVITNPLFKRQVPAGSEVLTPAVTWSTTVFPIINVGLKPILVDVSLEDYNIDMDALEAAITPKTKVLMPVHLLGAPADMNRMMEIAEEKNLLVMEDTCESHGSEIGGRKAGSFGDLATFSFFMSHHITTVEGGMLVTNNEEIFEMAKAMRAFGWIRDLKNKESYAKQSPHVDPNFLFVNTGYNFRPTEMQGAFGMHQVGKLEKFIEARRKNHFFWNKALEEFSDYLILPQERKGTRHVAFAYALTVKPNAPFTKKALVEHLNKNLIETRQIEAGNMAEQPAMKILPHAAHGDLPNSKLIMKNGFFFGNHQALGKEEREYIANVISDFVRKNT